MWITLEGNIGSGKTTLFEALKARHPEWIFAPEPVHEWTLPRNDLDGQSMLSKFYEDPDTQGAFFQTYALSTRLKILEQLVEAVASPTQVILSERTPETDAHIFAPLVSMTSFERACYQSIQDSLYAKQKNALHTVIYLQTDPEVCLQRIRERGRPSETNIPLDQLTKLHLQHERQADFCQKERNVFTIANNSVSKEDVVNQVESILEVVTDISK